MNFDSRYIWDALPLLMQGLQLTLIISLSGLLGGLIIGLLAGTCRALGGTISKTVSLVFVEVIRGTPIMVQVMFIYFALPMVLPVRIDPVPAARALSMPTGASSLVTIEKAQIPSATTAIQTRAGAGWRGKAISFISGVSLGKMRSARCADVPVRSEQATGWPGCLREWRAVSSL